MSDFKLNFIHLCDEATFSQEGKLSLIGIFDTAVNTSGVNSDDACASDTDIFSLSVFDIWLLVNVCIGCILYILYNCIFLFII